MYMETERISNIGKYKVFNKFLIAEGYFGTLNYVSRCIETNVTFTV